MLACQHVNVKACQHMPAAYPYSMFHNRTWTAFFCFKTLNGFKPRHFAYRSKNMRYKSTFFHRQKTIKWKRVFFRRLCLILPLERWLNAGRGGWMSRKIKEITKLHPTEMTRWGLHSVAVFTNGEHIFFTNSSTAVSSYSFKTFPRKKNSHYNVMMADVLHFSIIYSVKIEKYYYMYITAAFVCNILLPVIARPIFSFWLRGNGGELD